MSKETIEKLTKLRVHSSAILNTYEDLPKSRGASASFTALQKGRMYVGELEMSLGKEFPYKETEKATKAEEIQEATDVTTKKMETLGNEVEDLVRVRKVLDGQLDVIRGLYSELKAKGRSVEAFEQNANYAEAFRCYKEARMWLGVRLGELRDNAK